MHIRYAVSFKPTVIHLCVKKNTALICVLVLSIVFTTYCFVHEATTTVANADCVPCGKAHREYKISSKSEAET